MKFRVFPKTPKNVRNLTFSGTPKNTSFPKSDTPESEIRCSGTRIPVPDPEFLGGGHFLGGGVQSNPQRDSL